VSFLETEKTDLEKRLDRRSKSPLSALSSASHHLHFGGGDVVDHVRTQIPLLASSSSPAAMAASGGEQLIRFKLLEQENERYIRKIKGLESQLSELERVHGSRIQDLLSDRRRERDKENHRQREVLRQMEDGLKTREKIYKERIRGLEEQVDVLKDQLTKEMRRRQVFIAGDNHDKKELKEKKIA
jgi:hypothetical protein